MSCIYGTYTFTYCIHIFLHNVVICKDIEARSGPEGSRKLRFPDFMTTAQDGGRLSALRTGLLEGFYVNEKSADTSWDRTSDLPIFSTAP